jgi:hypothetical protein
MNAVDITARGLAARALKAEAETNEGAASLASRSEPTAAALEALSGQFPALTGVAGASHTVETSPFLTRDRLVIRGNGAELRNVNTTPLSTSNLFQTALPVGSSNVWGTRWLTYYPVVSSAGAILTVAPGDGDNFAVGDLVVVHGATNYYISNGDYYVYRNYTRARVLAATDSTIILDRALPVELAADQPIVGVAGAGAEAGFVGPSQYYLLYAPHVSNITLASDVGETLQWGGVIDGIFRDLTLIGRNGIALNAMQDCLIENVRFQSWRKIAEISEGSFGTVLRSFRGSLSDASTRLGGGDDTAPFFMSIDENSAHCAFEDFDVDSGPNNATGGTACLLAAGHDNVIRNSSLKFPAHTGIGLGIRSHGPAGSPNVDCGYENIQLYLPNGSRFFSASDSGSGVTRPYFRNIRCFGTVSIRAGDIEGDQGVVENVWCETGGFRLFDPCTNWRIENNYFPDGFESLTRQALTANTIRNNESDASRRIATAAIVDTAQDSITSTTPNDVAYSMTIAPGDLAALDEVHLRLAGTTGGGGTNTRHVRITCQMDGATAVEIAHMTSVADGDCWAIEGTIEVQTNTAVHAAVKELVGPATTCKDTRVTGGDLAADGLVLTVEIWTDGEGSVLTQLVKIAGQKAGMRNVPVFG